MFLGIAITVVRYRTFFGPINQYFTIASYIGDFRISAATKGHTSEPLAIIVLGSSAGEAASSKEESKCEWKAHD